MGEATVGYEGHPDAAVSFAPSAHLGVGVPLGDEVRVCLQSTAAFPFPSVGVYFGDVEVVGMGRALIHAALAVEWRL